MIVNVIPVWTVHTVNRWKTSKPVHCTMYGLYCTALRNHMRIVFEGMSSWTPLTMYLGMNTTFLTKYILNKYVRIFIMIIFDFHNIIRICILTLNYHYNPILWALSCRELHFFKYAFSSITLKTLNLHNKSPNTFAFYIFGLKCCLHP